MTQHFNKFLLTLISLIMLVHSVSLYAISAPGIEEFTQVEMTQEAQDVEDQQVQVKVYDALIPTFHSMAPLVLYFINEVVLLSQAEYQEINEPVHYENQLLEVLFPLIISPNAP